MRRIALILSGALLAVYYGPGVIRGVSDTINGFLSFDRQPDTSVELRGFGHTPHDMEKHSKLPEAWPKGRPQAS